MTEKAVVFIAVLKASAVAALAWLIVVFLPIALHLRLTRTGELIDGILSLCLGTALGAWQTRRGLDVRFTKDYSGRMARAFAFSEPFSLLISVVLAEIPGEYVAYFGRAMGLFGAVFFVVLSTAALNFAASLLALPRSTIREHSLDA